MCLNSSHVLDLQRQRELFQIALDELAQMDGLINKAMEVFEREDDSVEVVVYDIPETD